MIPFNVLEQMDSETLALVHANGGQHAWARAFEIARNLVGSEGSHSQVGMISVDDERVASAGDAERVKPRMATLCLLILPSLLLLVMW